MKNIILLIVTILTIYSCATNTQKNDYKHYEFVLIKIPIDQKSSQMVLFHLFFYKFNDN